jgi:cell division septation protein DedD
LAHHVQDDAFHEIQLNGKQLVFLFMVTTVVLAVAFLSGVFVGRGVRLERAAALADAGAVSPVTTPDVVVSREAAPAVEGSDPTAAAPPPAVDELSYFSRLEKQGQPDEDLRPAAKADPPAAALAETPRDPAPPAQKPEALARASSPSSPPASNTSAPLPAVDASLAEPSGDGFVLQVSALNERGPAEQIAKRLSAKGYSAYVTTPASGAASKLYRVRIGKFKTRREAEAIAVKVQKEEQIQPWITR